MTSFSVVWCWDHWLNHSRDSILIRMALLMCRMSRCSVVVRGREEGRSQSPKWPNIKLLLPLKWPTDNVQCTCTCTPCTYGLPVVNWQVFPVALTLFRASPRYLAIIAEIFGTDWFMWNVYPKIQPPRYSVKRPGILSARNVFSHPTCTCIVWVGFPLVFEWSLNPTLCNTQSHAIDVGVFECVC